MLQDVQLGHQNAHTLCGGAPAARWDRLPVAEPDKDLLHVYVPRQLQCGNMVVVVAVLAHVRIGRTRALTCD